MIMLFDDEASLRGFRVNVKSKVGKGIQQYSKAHTTVGREVVEIGTFLARAFPLHLFIFIFLEGAGGGVSFRDVKSFCIFVPRWMTFIHRCISACMRSSHN